MTTPTFQKVEIKPIELLGEAKNLMGEQYWLFVGICALGMLIAGAVPFGILLGPMMVGIYLCFIRKASGETVKFEVLFKGFDYFLESLLVALILAGIGIVIAVPLQILGFILMGVLGAATSAGDPDTAGVVAAIGGIVSVGIWIVLVAAIVAVMTLFAFAFPLVIDQHMKAIDAIKTSYHAVRANLMGMIGLTVVSGILSMVAALFCYLPVFLVFPLTLGANFLAYRKIFPDSKVQWDAEGMPIKPEEVAAQVPPAST